MEISIHFHLNWLNKSVPNLSVLSLRIRDTFRRGFEERLRELLENNTDVEINNTGARNIDANPLNREPQEEILGGNPRQGADLAITQSAGNISLVMQLILEHRITLLIQKHEKAASVLIELVIPDALGK